MTKHNLLAVNLNYANPYWLQNSGFMVQVVKVGSYFCAKQMNPLLSILESKIIILLYFTLLY